jgi:hypothetical protein
MAFRILSSALCAALAAAAAPALRGSAGHYLFNSSDSTGASILMTYSSDGNNLTISFLATPETSKVHATSWVAVAVNTANGTGMAPAMTWWFGLDANGNVYLEDRQITVAEEPKCYSAQLSLLTASSTQGSGNNLVVLATITRPLTVSATYKALGYIDIPNQPLSLLAAIGDGARTGGCSMGHNEHYHHWSRKYKIRRGLTIKAPKLTRSPTTLSHSTDAYVNFLA